MTRITATDVTIIRDELIAGERIITARVRGRNCTYLVDAHSAWATGWSCTCGRNVRSSLADCPHIRATKEAVA